MHNILCSFRHLLPQEPRMLEHGNSKTQFSNFISLKVSKLLLLCSPVGVRAGGWYFTAFRWWMSASTIIVVPKFPNDQKKLSYSQHMGASLTGPPPPPTKVVTAASSTGSLLLCNFELNFLSRLNLFTSKNERSCNRKVLRRLCHSLAEANSHGNVSHLQD